jgi:hypothetical protein
MQQVILRIDIPSFSLDKLAQMFYNKKRRRRIDTVPPAALRAGGVRGAHCPVIFAGSHKQIEED